MQDNNIIKVSSKSPKRGNKLLNNPICNDNVILQNPTEKLVHNYNMHSEILDNIQDEIKRSRGSVM